MRIHRQFPWRSLALPGTGARKWQLFAILWVVVLGSGSVWAQALAPRYPEHQDLSYFLDAEGAKVAITTPADWAKRRAHLLAHMQSVMGEVPNATKRVALDLKVVEEVLVNGLRRQKVSYQTEPATRNQAYLFLPMVEDKAQPKRPAVLCLHQTIAIGKQEPAGMGGNPNLHYALHLAQRGYITLAPDYPSFGEYAYTFPAEAGYLSGSMKAIWDNIRAVDLLQSLPGVDGERIGCIGHSLGGHNTMFTAVFEPRIKALVSNCGFTRFHKYYNGALMGWTSDRYMPRIRTVHHNNPDEVPFDFTEIVAAFAPRPFLASAPVRDSNFEVSGVKDCIRVARPIYELHGVAGNLAENYPESEHDFPADAREVAYRFLDKHLRGQ